MIVTSHKDQPFEPELNIMDEDRIIRYLNKYPCPICHGFPGLWRLITPGPKVRFQVRCDWPICPQKSIPETPVSDAQKAVQAWCVYCAMVRGT